MSKQHYRKNRYRDNYFDDYDYEDNHGHKHNRVKEVWLTIFSIVFTVCFCALWVGIAIINVLTIVLSGLGVATCLFFAIFIIVKSYHPNY